MPESAGRSLEPVSVAHAKYDVEIEHLLFELIKAPDTDLANSQGETPLMQVCVDAQRERLGSSRQGRDSYEVTVLRRQLPDSDGYQNL